MIIIKICYNSMISTSFLRTLNPKKYQDYTHENKNKLKVFYIRNVSRINRQMNKNFNKPTHTNNTRCQCRNKDPFDQTKLQYKPILTETTFSPTEPKTSKIKQISKATIATQEIRFGAVKKLINLENNFLSIEKELNEKRRNMIKSNCSVKRIQFDDKYKGKTMNDFKFRPEG